MTAVMSCNPAVRMPLPSLLGIRTQGKIGYSGTRTQINVVLTITLNTPGSVYLTFFERFSHPARTPVGNSPKNRGPKANENEH